jgi:hypothetical protein
MNINTLKVARAVLVLAGTTSFAFAGPGPQYWQAKAHKASEIKASAVMTPTNAEKTTCSCKAACHVRK